MAFEIGALGMSTFITSSVLAQQATKLFRIHKNHRSRCDLMKSQPQPTKAQPEAPT